MLATIASDEVPSGGALPFAPGSATYIAAITASGATNLNITGGSGLGFALSGGGGGGGANASVSATGSTAPSSATEVGFIDSSGSLRAPSKTYPFPNAITDPAAGYQSAVLAFHNTDNQALSGTTYGLNTGGVAQLVNNVGNLDRQRETGFDGIPPSASPRARSSSPGRRFRRPSPPARSPPRARRRTSRSARSPSPIAA